MGESSDGDGDVAGFADLMVMGTESSSHLTCIHSPGLQGPSNCFRRPTKMLLLDQTYTGSFRNMVLVCKTLGA